MFRPSALVMAATLTLVVLLLCMPAPHGTLAQDGDGDGDAASGRFNEPWNPPGPCAPDRNNDKGWKYNSIRLLPDGKSALVNAERGGEYCVCRMWLDGKTQTQVLAKSADPIPREIVVSHDGRFAWWGVQVAYQNPYLKSAMMCELESGTVTEMPGFESRNYWSASAAANAPVTAFGRKDDVVVTEFDRRTSKVKKETPLEVNAVMVALSPDGKMVAAAVREQGPTKLAIYDAKRKKEHATFTFPDGYRIWGSMEFVDDSRLLVSVSRDRASRKPNERNTSLYDIDIKKKKMTELQTEVAPSAWFSLRGEWLLGVPSSNDSGGTAMDLEGRLLWEMHAYNDVTPNGQSMVSIVGEYRELSITDIARLNHLTSTCLKPIRTIPYHEARPDLVALAGRELLYCNSQEPQTIRRLNVDTGDLQRLALTGDRTGIRELFTSASGNAVVVVAKEGVDVYSLTTAERTMTVDLEARFAITPFAGISSDGRRVAVYDRTSERLAMYDATNGTELWHADYDLGQLYTGLFSPDDSRYLMWVDGIGYVVVEPDTGKTVQTFRYSHKDCAGWAADGSSFVVVPYQGGPLFGARVDGDAPVWPDANYLRDGVICNMTDGSTTALKRGPGMA